METTEQTTALAQRFEIVIESNGNASSLAFSGRLDGDGIFGLEAALIDADEEGVRSMILDLRGLTGVDPQALASMLDNWIRSPRQTLELILVRVPISVRRALEQAGLDRALPIAYESNGSATAGT